MSDIITGLQVKADKKAQTVTIEFPYGKGIACEIPMDAVQASKLSQALIAAGICIGWNPTKAELDKQMEELCDEFDQAASTTI